MANIITTRCGTLRPGTGDGRGDSRDDAGLVSVGPHFLGFIVCAFDGTIDFLYISKCVMTTELSDCVAQ